MASSDWKAAGQAYAQEVLSRIPPEWRLPNIPSPDDQRDVTGPYIHQFLSAEEIEITETDAVGIVAKTTSGIWSAVQVTKAFCHRAALAHQLLNCLHEIFFDLALQDAERADDFYKQNGRPIGPLHGLPISLKDQFHVKGVSTHMGYIGWIGTFQGVTGTGKERVYETEMAKELRTLGAILYVKTAVPHTLMSGETANNIVGYTFNPRNRFLSAGGSSGGEGALIGLKGSPVGFGTDIGGSIRIPAAFNGLYGLRPSVGRLPYEGLANSLDGQGTIPSVVGPLATSPGSLKLIVQSLLSVQPWLQDPGVHPMPWRDDPETAILDPFRRLSRPLTFGVVRHDGGCAPHPPVSRAIETVVKTLQAQGHKIIDWKPTPTHQELTGLAARAFDLDGGADCNNAFALSGEPSIPQVIINSGPEATASQIMALNVEKRNAVKQYGDYWNSTAALTGTGRPVDAVITPLAPFAAARPETFKYYGYSMFVNTLDYTAAIVPVTTVDKNVDKRIDGFEGVSDVDRFIQDSYDPLIFDGAHVSVQLIGRRLEEEKMIALATYVGDLLHQKS